jgi:hypothetical protein
MQSVLTRGSVKTVWPVRGNRVLFDGVSARALVCGAQTGVQKEEEEEEEKETFF